MWDDHHRSPPFDSSVGGKFESLMDENKSNLVKLGLNVTHCLTFCSTPHAKGQKELVKHPEDGHRVKDIQHQRLARSFCYVMLY